MGASRVSWTSQTGKSLSQDCENYRDSLSDALTLIATVRGYDSPTVHITNLKLWEPSGWQEVDLVKRGLA